MTPKRRTPKAGKAQPTRQRLVEAALELIVKNGGCRGVNLRQIAARAGCTHANAYNFFDSLEELFWAAAHLAIERQLADIARNMESDAAKKEPLRSFFSAQVAFAQKNPSIYRLFWLEALAGQAPSEVLQRLNEARMSWVQIIGGRLASLRSRTDPAWAGQIIHGYFHGEVCKLVGRQAFVPKSDDDRERIVSNTLALVDLVAAAGPR
jgi:AcrR family transcriptional regulator